MIQYDDNSTDYYDLTDKKLKYVGSQVRILQGK